MKSRLTADVAETYPFRNLFDDENQAGIAAKQALDKSHNKDVKAFAEAMVQVHEAVNKQALALLDKLKAKPEDNGTSKSHSPMRRQKARRAVSCWTERPSTRLTPRTK